MGADVALDAGNRAAADRADVEGAAAGPGEDAVQAAGVAVTEERAVATGEDGGQAAALEGEERAADGVDAAVDAVQAAEQDPGADHLCGVAEGAELLEGDDVVLTPGEVRETSVI